jgi:PilZ domain
MAIGVLAVLASVGGVAFIGWRGLSSARGRRPAPPPAPDIRRERRTRSRIIPTTERPAELQIVGAQFMEMPEIKDVSTTGLAISVPHRFNGETPTQEVEVLLTLHGQGTVRARGEIRHVSHARHSTFSFGVEFVEISDDDRDRIARYVDDMAAQKITTKGE